MKYQVVCGDKKHLEQQVNLLIEDGWVPFGSHQSHIISQAWDENLKIWQFSQAMIKQDELTVDLESGYTLQGQVDQIDVEFPPARPIVRNLSVDDIWGNGIQIPIRLGDQVWPGK